MREESKVKELQYNQDRPKINNYTREFSKGSHKKIDRAQERLYQYGTMKQKQRQADTLRIPNKHLQSHPSINKSPKNS